MNVGVAHSEVNPNTRVMNSRGIWLTYLLLTVVLHIVLLSIPFLSVPIVWTLTNVIHNLVGPRRMHLFKAMHAGNMLIGDADRIFFPPLRTAWMQKSQLFKSESLLVKSNVLV